MAAAGSAVGLGNIWKFPFEVGKGGGAAFVVMYLVFCFALCFPVMVTEIAIGRKTQRNPVGAFNALGFRKWNWVGKLGILSGVLILSFYNVVAAWAFGHFIEIILGNLGVMATENANEGAYFGDFIADILKVSLYAVLFMVSTGLVVAKGVSKGIEKATKILMPTLIVLILGLVFYSLTLPHAMDGVKFYLKPDFSNITLETVYKALGQAFFSLSLGMGALITYGSYVSKKDNIVKSATLITLMDVGIAFIAGLMMFPLVAYMTNGSMADVGEGAGLIFVTLPGVFESLGLGLGTVIGGLFFLLLSFAALTSTVSLLEVPVSYVVDEHGAKRNRAVWITAIIIFIVGIPSMLSGGYSEFFTNFVTYFGAEKATSFLDLVNDIASESFLPLGGFLITLFAAYVWKKSNLTEELSQGHEGFAKSFISKYINFAIMFLCPVVLGSIFVLTVLNKFFGVSVAWLGL